MIHYRCEFGSNDLFRRYCVDKDIQGVVLISKNIECPWRSRRRLHWWMGLLAHCAALFVWIWAPVHWLVLMFLHGHGYVMGCIHQSKYKMTLNVEGIYRVPTGSEKSVKTVLVVKSQRNWVHSEKSVKCQWIWLVGSENEKRELNLRYALTDARGMVCEQIWYWSNH